MSYDELLVNTIEVFRPTVTYVKGVSNKVYPVVATGTNIKCNIQFLSSGQVPKEYGYEVEGSWWGFFEYGANVLKDDKIVDEDDREFIVKSMPLDTVGLKHHIEARLAIEE